MFRAISILLFLGFTTGIFSQDSLLVEPEQKAKPVVKLKPMLGFGVGTMTFYGDVGKGFRSNSALTSSRAYHFTAELKLNPYLNFKFTGFRSQLTLNEPGLNVLHNFRSEITGGSAIINYNFHHLLSKKDFCRPYFGIGISSIEFLSKTDLHDANGLKYHLWSNGSLMSMDESAEDAHEAIPLERDFTYETDLRSLNTENRGFYTDNAISIPLAFGLDFRFSEHFKVNLGTTLYYSLNDQIDNVSSAPNGDGAQDMLLHSSFGFSYDLHTKDKVKSDEELEFEDDAEFLLADYFDADMDGVNDLDDECLGHPEGIEVDAKGCPLDGDKDGVPDYMDDEPQTSEGTLVDQYGVTLEDEDLLDRYIYWIDSLSSAQVLSSKVYSDKPTSLFSVLVFQKEMGLIKKKSIQFFLKKM